MKTAFRTLPVLALLAAGCTDKCHDPSPSACATGSILAHTCMAGTLIQLKSGGQTVWYDVDGKGKKKYTHVIATYSDLGNDNAAGQVLYFTSTPGGSRDPLLCCFANDAPDQEVKLYTLTNVSTVSCDATATAQ